MHAPRFLLALPLFLVPALTPAEGWKNTRSLVDALFLRRFDKEYLEEMKGIADGASAAGARFNDRPIDLVDIAGLNCWPEIETFDSALEANPTGLEGELHVLGGLRNDTHHSPWRRSIVGQSPPQVCRTRRDPDPANATATASRTPPRGRRPPRARRPRDQGGRRTGPGPLASSRRSGQGGDGVEV